MTKPSDEAMKLARERAEWLRSSCKADFMGGHSGKEYEAFVHGMDTVCNVIADVWLAQLLDEYADAKLEEAARSIWPSDWEVADVRARIRALKVKP